MKKSDELFHLIKSLAKSEKTYFRKFSKLHGSGEENNYIRLFDAIEKQAHSSTVYDEVSLKKKFRDEKFAKQFNVAKLYLYHQILKSLRNYHSARSVELELKELLEYVEIFFNKALYDQCSNFLKKARRLAMDNQHFRGLLDVLHWERELLFTRFNIKNAGEYVEKDMYETLMVLDKLKTISRYNNLSARMNFLILKMGNIRSKEETKELEKIMSDTLMKNHIQANSFYALLTYLNIQANSCYVKRDHEKSYFFNNKIVRLWQAHPTQVCSNIRSYIAAVNNLMIDQRHLGKYEEALETVYKLRKLPEIINKYVNEDTLSRVFTRSYVMELSICNDMGQFDKAINNVAAISAGLKRYEKSISLFHKLLIHFKVAYAYFGLARYDKSIDWINPILNERDLSLREDIHSEARLLNLLIHYELNNFHLLGHLLKSTLHFLSKKSRLYAFERTILEYFKFFLKAKHEKEQMGYFIRLRITLIGINKNEKTKIMETDIISWVESKIQNRPFKEIVNEKARKI